MVRLFSPSASLRLLCLPAVLALLGSLGCVTDTGGGTTLYVYDNAASTVQVWADVNAVYTAQQAGTAIPPADRTITSTTITGDLAWGGLAIDSTGNMLYLVSDAGVVFAISQASTQNGALTLTSDITSFNLGLAASDRLSPSSVFGQAAVDPSSNTLYVMENASDGSSTRVWRITGASRVGQTLGNGYTFTPAASYTIGVGTDTFGAGVATLQGGSVFGLFGGGAALYDPLQNTYGGPRLRYGQGGSFPQPMLGVSGNVLIGTNTGLGNSLTYGALGYDTQNNALYVFAQGLSAIEVFSQGQFLLGTFNQAPKRTLADAASVLTNLRVISHPTNSDWLLGANFTADSTAADAAIGGGTGGTALLIWKAPSAGGSALSATLPGVTEIRGMAIGGNN